MRDVEKFLLICFLISGRYDFCVSKKHCAISCNVLLKHDSVFCTSRRNKESGLKILKLS